MSRCSALLSLPVSRRASLTKIAGNARLSGQLKRAAVDAVPLLIRTGRYPARA
jgi:hypothetical protein